MMTKRAFIAILGLIYSTAILCGCEGKKDEPGVVEYMTGAQDIKAYKRTKSKLDDINKTLKERYQE